MSKIPNKFHRVLPTDRMMNLVNEIWHDTHPLGQMPNQWDQLLDSLDPDQVVMLKNSLVAIITIAIQESRVFSRENAFINRERLRGVKTFKNTDPLEFFKVEK